MSDFSPDSLALALALAAGLLGGFVRGYSGFGFALAAVPILSIGTTPALAVPAVLTFEFMIGLVAVRRERQYADRRMLLALIAGSVVGTPLGVLLLMRIPSDQMRVVVAATVAILVLVLWFRRHSPLRLGWARLLACGLASGVLNGALAMSGPPAILALMGSSLPPQVVRGILAIFIFFSAGIGLALAYLGGLVTPATLETVLWMLPGVLFGLPAGTRMFQAIPNRHYRGLSLGLLLVVSVVSLVLAANSLL